ncbi:cytochrome-c peroxidase [Flavobacterium sedimenticola]|uniref:Cytochrome c peroxidase n=1 Tax=Flavobacterium sedimenticola TaxID=3043286 RepID=A0ABT6XTD1_9FLAO|nr:cytochrome c peroxidase [Flavobacterium sedimenticola]MDI9258351.1 cytochrome c peroxidase [Flavobacterium sedimenticola]
MKRAILILGFGGVVFGILAFSKSYFTPLYFEVPKSWPQPEYDFKKNPLSEEKFQLGRHLFYDPILSRDNSISCSSCHAQATGFTHVDHDLSHGIEGKKGTRNSLALINLAWNKDFHWDGGVNNLEVQPINPITNPVEMDEKLEHVVAKLQQSSKYRNLFAKAYGDEKVTSQRLLKALAQFTVSLKSTNSKYDQVMRGETSFDAQEQNGYVLFKKHCASCHTEPLFNSDKFERNGLAVDTALNDLGRIKITGRKEDHLRFKIPTLRNIQFTKPYMHDGRFKTLNEVIKHYNSLGHDKSLPKELAKPMNLSDNERVDMEVFLNTLTDKTFLFNPRFQFPRE